MAALSGVVGIVMENTWTLRIVVGMSACFSANNYSLEVHTRNDQCLVRIAATHGVGCSYGQAVEHRVARIAVESFIATVSAILGQPEQLRGDQCTSVYHAEADLGGKLITAKSAELPDEYLQEMLLNQHVDSVLRKKIKATLDLGYHNWSHELFSATERFVALCRSEYQV